MAEKTEAPTHRRLEEARERGQVARSHELNAAIALIAGIWLLSGPGRSLVVNLGSLLRETFSNLPTGELTQAGLRQIFYQNLVSIISPMGTFVLGLAVVGVATSLIQSGAKFASKRPFVDMNRVNPLMGFKRIFSPQGLVEVLKALLKLAVVGWPVYTFLRGSYSQILSLAQMDLSSAVSSWVQLAVSLMWRIGGAYLALAAADYAYQRWQWMKSLRMTKQEVLEDLKRSEGDPFMRGRIRQQQRRMARMRMMSKVPHADVIVTNPTHFAVAIKYDADKMSAPVVVAKGAYLVAQRIVGIAKENHVPVVQNVPLAQALYRLVEIDHEVPPDLYLTMAEVLAYVYKLRGVSTQTVTA